MDSFVSILPNYYLMAFHNYYLWIRIIVLVGFNTIYSMKAIATQQYIGVDCDLKSVIIVLTELPSRCIGDQVESFVLGLFT